MPERNLEFGRFGARGIRGSDAVARKLSDRQARTDGTPEPPDEVGPHPQGRPRSRAEGERADAEAWLEGKRQPSKANLERIDAAYRVVRRRNVARHLLQCLNSHGGTRVEIHPLNQSQVSRPHQRVVAYRTMNIRRWESIVGSWAAGDHQGLDDVWDDTIVDLGSQWGQYEYVTNMGFAA